MDKAKISEYVLSKSSVEAPELQERFGLSYAETKAVIAEMVSVGMLEYERGVTYVIKQRPSVKAQDDVTVPKSARELLEALEKRRHGDRPDRFGGYNDDSDDSDDDDDENDDGIITDENGEDVLDGIDLRDALVTSVGCGLKEKYRNETYVLGLDGGLEFELKFINGGDGLRVSDCGNTIKQRPDLTRRRVCNVLAAYPAVDLDDNELFVTVSEPHGVLMALLMLYAAVDAIGRLK